MAVQELALITGASMGLGAEYARQLAARKINLLLTARSERTMYELSEELKREHGIATYVCPADLSRPGAAEELFNFVQKKQLRPNWLINNAGFGAIDTFDTQSPETVRDLCMVNMVALTELTARFLPLLKAAPRGTARILNIASVAGFQPVPYFAVYCASKAYVLSFSEALHEELKPRGIRVLTVCPGYTATNFGKTSGMHKTLFTNAQSPVKVVRDSLKASDAGRALIVHRNHAQLIAVRMLPRTAVRKIAALVAKTYR